MEQERIDYYQLANIYLNKAQNCCQLSQEHREGLGPSVLYLNKPLPNWNGDINRITDDGNTELFRNINTTDAGVNYRVRTTTKTIKIEVYLKFIMKVTYGHNITSKSLIIQLNNPHLHKYPYEKRFLTNIKSEISFRNGMSSTGASASK